LWAEDTIFSEVGKKVHLSVPKIYDILAEQYVIRSKWQKNKQRGPIPTAMEPRQVIQMDTIDFGELFAFTTMDIFSKVDRLTIM
jgi:hypothetical protein